MADQAVEEATRREHPVAVCMSLVYTDPGLPLERRALTRAAAVRSNVSLRMQRALFAGALSCDRARSERRAHDLARRAGGGRAVAPVALLQTLNAERFNILATAFFRALAEGMMRSGQLGEAATMIDRALALADQAGETYDRPDLLRVWAEIRLAHSPPDVRAAEELAASSALLGR